MPRDSFLSICRVWSLLSSPVVHYRMVISRSELPVVCFSGEAEAGLERLHQCAEKELQLYLNAEGPSKEFNEFRTKLAGLTRYCNSYR